MRQYTCKECANSFDEPVVISGTYREYSGASQQTYSNETCPKCGSSKLVDHWWEQYLKSRESELKD